MNAFIHSFKVLQSVAVIMSAKSLVHILRHAIPLCVILPPHTCTRTHTYTHTQHTLSLKHAPPPSTHAHTHTLSCMTPVCPPSQPSCPGVTTALLLPCYCPATALESRLPCYCHVPAPGDLLLPCYCHVPAPGDRSAQLETQARRETDALDPRHTGVPWVVVNGVPVYDAQDNLKQLVCVAYWGQDRR